jgi:hypothetical protein
MICRNCGTEIADRAIVCYRCGTSTAEPVRRPAEIRPRRFPVVPFLVLVILAVLLWYAGRHYHVFGVEIRLDPAYSGPLLINFAPIHA